MTDSLPPIEFEPLKQEGPKRPSTSEGRNIETRAFRFFVASAVVAVVAVVSWTVTSSDDNSSRLDPVADTTGDGLQNGPVGPGYDGVVEIAGSIPAPLLAAEFFIAEPNRSTARSLFGSLGGFDGLQVAAADGAFDLVRFDPLDNDRLLASRRLSYGEAENNDINELWMISFDQLDQELWRPNFDHDFVHFNTDGTATVWVYGGGAGFISRIAQLLTNEFAPQTSTEPMFASRFTADNGFVFALTGSGDYYGNETEYYDLIADDGNERTILAPASSFDWIDNPVVGLLVAYPDLPTDRTRVWDTSTLAPIEGHPLAERPYRRSAISSDGSTAIGVTFDRVAEVIDLSTGAVVRRFGDLDIGGVDQPLTLSGDGSVAITIERSGRVTMWWVESGTPIATVFGDAAQPRWLSEEYAAQSTSVAAADASRIALRIGARPEVGVQWSIIDMDVGSWVQQACALAGRPLNPTERSAIGLEDAEHACT